jgi:integrase
MLTKLINSMKGTKQMKDTLKSILKQMFAIAHNDKLIDKNPTLNLPKSTATAPTRKRQALDQDQESRMIEIGLTDTKYDPLLICLLQGTRKGEMLALRPNDFCELTRVMTSKTQTTS